jgi:Flp pilus assembly protein TadG
MDLGMAFAQKRTVQNAADAAALAGARQVARYTDAAPTSAQPDAGTYATNALNRVASTNQTLFYCKYVNYDGSEQGECNAPVTSAAKGVRAKVREQHQTYFIRVIPGAPTSVTTEATAMAFVERYTTPTGDAPFLLCGSSAWAVRDENGASLNNQKGISLNILTAANKINPAYVGYTFRVHDNSLSQGQASSPASQAGCGTTSASFNGLAGTGNENAAVPGWFNYQSGTQVGNISVEVPGVGGCRPPQNTDCVMFLPVARNSPTPTDKQIHVVTLAPFRIACGGNNCQYHDATLVDDFIVTGPSDRDWCRDCNGTVVIRMAA